MNSTLAKVFGWMQFVITLVPQVFAPQGGIHGWQAWVTSIASFGAAVAIHASSNTDGTK